MEIISGIATKSLLTPMAALIGACVGAVGTILANQSGIGKQNKLARLSSHQENCRLYYLPLYRASFELDDRIGKIIAVLDTDWLDSKYLPIPINTCH
jgi:hypothetical protein